ncbi:hypothetical protein C804_00956 [Lachnospiraceae bacterium A4]|nr:hypothetical protein C804_00956 [Lachnospiraceae bacterium A4]
MITKGNEIRLIKPMGVFDHIGEVCEVTDISEDGVISFKFGGCHLGCMSYNEFEKYFELVEKEAPEKEINEDTNSMTENKEVYELIEWCKENDKPFYLKLYLNVLEKRNSITQSILGMYKNRLCLVQFKNKTFKDSDFSGLKIML